MSDLAWLSGVVTFAVVFFVVRAVLSDTNAQREVLGLRKIRLFGGLRPVQLFMIAGSLVIGFILLSMVLVTVFD